MALPAGEREGFSDGSWRFFEDWDDRDAVQARCERGGGFEFSSLAPGRWWIGPRPGQGPLPAYALGVEIHPGDPDQSTLLSLRYLEDFELGELAEILGIPEGTVKSRLHHASAALRARLERMDP